MTHQDQTDISEVKDIKISHLQNVVLCRKQEAGHQIKMGRYKIKMTRPRHPVMFHRVSQQL